MSSVVATWTKQLHVDTLAENLGVVCPAALNPAADLLLLGLEVHTTRADSTGRILAVGLVSGFSSHNRLVVLKHRSVLFRADEADIRGSRLPSDVAEDSGVGTSDETLEMVATRLIEENALYGVDAAKGFAYLQAVLADAAADGTILCGQTLTSFALPRLESYGCLGSRYPRLLDTGMLIKSACIPTRAVDATAYEFYLRVAHRAVAGVRYSIPGFVLPVMFGDTGVPPSVIRVIDARSRVEWYAELSLHAFQRVREEALRA